MDFSSGSPPVGGQLDSAKKEQLLEALKAQAAIVNANQVLQNMSDKCFLKCVPKPGTSLDNSEQKCVAMCMDRYLDAFNLVSHTYAQRVNRELSKS